MDLRIVELQRQLPANEAIHLLTNSKEEKNR